MVAVAGEVYRKYGEVIESYSPAAALRGPPLDLERDLAELTAVNPPCNERR